METLGGILIIFGFIAGVYLGITLSRKKVLIDSSGNVDTKKQTRLSIVTAVCAFLLILGACMFFLSEEGAKTFWF